MKSELETCLDKKTRGWVNLFSYLIIPLTIFLIHFNTPAQTFVIGTGTQVNTSTGYPAPYGNSYSAAKHQILYKNYELVASGLTAGEIHKFGFNVANLNNSAVLNDFYISMKNTTTEALNSWETDLITVYGPHNYEPRLGWNLHTLDIPFTWDGSSNIVVEVCFQNSSSSFNALTYLEGPNFSGATRFLRGNFSNLCGATTSTSVLSYRPNTAFLRREEYGIGLYNLIGDQSEYSGTEVTYQIEVENIGTGTDVCLLSVLSQKGWGYKLYEHNTSNEISQIEMDSASTGIIDLKVTIPADAVLGAFDEVEVKGISQSDTTKRSSILIKTTAIAANSSYPFYEDFGNDFPPLAWCVVNTNRNSGWFQSSFNGYNNSSTSASQIWWQSIPAYNGDEWLISPRMNFDTTKEYYLTFYGKASTVDGNKGEVVKIYAIPQLSDTASVLRANGTLLKEIELTTTIKEYVIDLEAFSGKQVYIAFNHILQGVTSNKSYTIYVDEFKIAEKPNYSVQVSSPNSNLIGESGYSIIHNIEVFNRGLNTDIFSLNRSGGDPGWNYTFLEHNTNNPLTQITISGFDTVTVDLKVEIPASAINSEMNTTKVTVNSQSDLQVSSSIIIRTSAVKPIVSPHSEKFDNVIAPELPYGWKTIVSHFSAFAKVETNSDPVNNPVSQPNQVSLYNSTELSSNAQLLLIPPGVEDLNQCRIRFWARSRVSNLADNPILIIGTMSNPADYLTFVPFDTISNLTDNQKDYSISFQGYSGSNRHIAFKHGSPGAGTGVYIFIDNFVYETLPVTCLEPSQLGVTEATQNSVTLNWNENGGATAWEIKYGLPGFNPDSSGTLITDINSKPYKIELLSAATAYEAYVRSVCAEKSNSNWSNVLFFQTEQIPANLPFTETFEDTLSNWSFVNGNQINKWHIGNAVAQSGARSAYISSTDGVTNAYSLNQSNVTHIFRDIKFPDVNGVFNFSFYWKAQGQYQSDYLKLYLVPTTVIPQEGVVITRGMIGLERYNQNNQWKKETFLLPDSLRNKTYRLVFSWINDDNYGSQPPAAIDSLHLFAIPYGSLKGVVKNSSGDPIPNATVYSNEIIYNANSSGFYFVPDIEPGEYFFTSATGGYSADTATIIITSNDTTTHDFVLPYSNPDLPFALQFMPSDLSNRVSSAACTDGRYIYTSVTGENRVYVTDMIDPSSPNEKGYITVQSASKLFYNSNYLFVSTTDNKIHILDKPSSPDSFIIKIILNMEGRVKDISFNGDLAFILISNLSGSNSDKSKLLVYDFTEIANPIIKGSLLFDGISSKQYYNRERELMIIQGTNSNSTATIFTILNVENKDSISLLCSNSNSPKEYGLIGEKNYYITSSRVNGISYLRTYSTINPSAPVLLKEWEVPENKNISALVNVEGTIYLHTESTNQLIMTLVYDSVENNYYRGIDFNLTKGWAGTDYIILKEPISNKIYSENSDNRKYYITPTNTSPPVYIIKLEKPYYEPVTDNKLTIAITPLEAVQAGCTTTPSAGTYTFRVPTNVQISATEVTGWKFAYWIGASGGNPTTVLVEGEKEVIAVFEQIPVLTVAGKKGKEIFCPKELVPGDFISVGTATFSADEIDDWSFGSFKIDASGSGNDKLDIGSVKIEGPVNLTTNYLADDGTITVTFSPPLVVAKGSSVLFKISYKFNYDPVTYAHDTVRIFNWRTMGVSATPMVYPPGEIVGAARMDSLIVAPVRTATGYAFAKIQDAIDYQHTLNGDSIYVCDGGYVEQLAVTKQLHIKSINGPENTSIITDIDTASHYKGGVFINKDNCSLEGFTIYNLRGGDLAVDLSSCDNFLFKNSIIENYQNGIYGVGNSSKGNGYNLALNKFKNIDDTPIELSYISKATIQSNYFDYCSEDRTILVENVKQLLSIENNIANSSFKIAVIPEVTGDNSSAVVNIENNKIVSEDADSVGSILYKPEQYDSSSSPMKLTIKNNKNFRIEAEFVRNAEVSENTIPESIVMRNLYGNTKVEKNEIYGQAIVSDLIMDESKTFPNLIFSENSFKNAADAYLSLENIPPGDSLKYRQVTNNTWSSVGDIGTELIDVHSLRFAENKILGGFNKGLRIDNCTWILAEKNELTHHKYGIDLKSSENIILGGNLLSNNTNWGVFCDSINGIILDSNNIISNSKGVNLTNSEYVNLNSNIIRDNIFEGDTTALILDNITNELNIVNNTIKGKMNLSFDTGNIHIDKNILTLADTNLVVFDFSDLSEVIVTENVFDGYPENYLFLTKIDKVLLSKNKSQNGFNVLINNSHLEKKKTKQTDIRITNNQVLGDSSGRIVFLGDSLYSTVAVDSNKNFSVKVEKSKNASISYNLIENGIEINKLKDTTFIVGNTINGGIDYNDLEGSIVISGNTFKDSTFENKFNFDSFEKAIFSNNLFPIGGKNLFISLSKISLAEINYNKHFAPIYINVDNTGLQLDKKNANPLIEIIGNEVTGDTVGTINYNGAELQIPLKINLNKKFGVTAGKTYNAQIIDNYLLRVLDLSYLRGETQIKQNRAYAGAKIKHVNDDAVKQSRLIIEENTFRDDTTESYNKTALKLKHVLKGTAQINSHLIKSNRFDGDYSYKVRIDTSDYFSIENNILYGTLSIIKGKEFEIKENAFQIMDGKPVEDGINLFNKCEDINITANLIGGFSQNGISIMSNVKDVEIKNNKIGTDEDGLLAVPNLMGIHMYEKCSNIIIDGNLISGNSDANIGLSLDCSNNIIRNNVIGPNAPITERFTNAKGIELQRNCDGNLIEYNIISGLSFGIEIKDFDNTSCDNNVIDNNHFGVNNLNSSIQSNRVKLMNLFDVAIESGTGNKITNNYSPANGSFAAIAGKNSTISNNVIGMFNDGEFNGYSAMGIVIADSDNLIEHNAIYSHFPIRIEGLNTSRNSVKSNKIGVNRNGTVLIEPIIGVMGILLNAQTSSNHISNNIIGGNQEAAIWITDIGTRFNTVQDNIIGTDATFTKKFKNKRGIVVYNSQSNVIRHNTIGNSDSTGAMGLLIEGESTKNNLIYGNRIGTNITGIPKITNYFGIISVNTSENTISENKIWYNYTGLAEDNSNNIYHDNDVQFNYGNTGVSLNNSHSTFTGNIIANDSTDGFKCKNGSNPTIINNNIFNNRGFGLINIDPSIMVNAQNNWWGDPSGPSGSGPGTGNAVQGNVAFQNWLTQGISLTLKTSVDTLFSKPNQTDSVFLFYRNHNNHADTLKLTISSDKNWIISDTVLIVNLDSTGAGTSKVLISVPSNALIGESAKIFVNAVSQSDTFVNANDSMIVRLYSGELVYLRINPDSVECEPGDTLQFFVKGYDQHQNEIPLQVNWQSTGGSIDTTGKYVAGSIPGIYYTKVFDPGSSIADSALVKIKGQLQIPIAPVLISPLNNSTGISAASITIKWEPDTEADYYILQLSADSLFDSLIVDILLLTNSYTISNLNLLTDYYWRVKSFNSAGNSEWSEVRHFKTLGIPSAVTLLYPENNAINQPVEIEFRWSKAADFMKHSNKDNLKFNPASGQKYLSDKIGNTDYLDKGTADEPKQKSVDAISNYWFELVKDTIQLSGIIRDTTLTDTAKTVSNLDYLSNYYWRVKAKNETGWGDFTNWNKFTTAIEKPSIPILASPVNNSIGLVLPVNLVWHSSVRIEQYILQVALDSLFSNVVKIDTIGSDTTYTLQQINIFTKYYWRVRAKNTGGESDWSQIWSFKTLGSPTTVTLINPESNSVNQPINVHFFWTKAVDQLKKNQKDEKSFYALKEDKKIETIVSKNGKKDKQSVVNEIEPGKIELHGVVNSLIENNSYKKINNNGSDEENIKKSKLSIGNYWFELAEDTTEKAFVLNDTTVVDTFKTVDNLSYLTDYYWRIKAKNETGWGSFSDWSKFTTIIESPEIPVLITPANNSTGINSPITLYWAKTERCQNYIVQIGSDSLFNNVIKSDTIGIDTTYHFNQSMLLTYYYWRVKASNVGGESNWSSVWKFKTSGLPTIVNPIQPTPNSINQPVNLLFVWSKAVDQTKGKIEDKKPIISEKKKITNNDESITDSFSILKNEADTLPESVLQIKQSKTVLENKNPFNDGIEKTRRVVTHYWFELVTDTLSFANLFRDTTIVDTSITVNGLVYLTNYYWRVKAENNNGWGDFNSWNCFSTIIEKPEIPDLISPVNKSTNNPLTTPFLWSSAVRAENYRFVMGGDSTFSVVLVDSIISDTSITIANLYYYTDYYWHVKAINIGGEGDWSETWNLRTIPRPITWCNFNFPFSDTVMQFQSKDIYARVRVDSVTNQTGGIDSLIGWIGYNGENTNPEYWGNWIPAAFSSDIGNDDEYVAQIGTSLPPGTYYLASRFQYLGGDYVYGGYSSTGGGIWDSINNVSGRLHIKSPINTLWQRSISGNNIPQWFGQNTETGFGFGFVPLNSALNSVPRLFVVSRSEGVKVRILDAETGNDIGELITTGIGGGDVPLSDIEVSDDGFVFGSNVTLNTGSTPLKIYMWMNASASPVAIISFTSTDETRLGDLIRVTGNYSLGTAQIWAASSSNFGKVYKWSMTGSTFNQTPEIISLSDNAFGVNASVSPLPDETFYWNANGQFCRKYNSLGGLIGIIPNDALPIESGSIMFVDRMNNNEYVLNFQYGAEGNNARLLEVVNGEPAEALTYAITNTLGNALNNGGIGDIAIRHNLNGNKDIFVLATNNGIAAYRTVESIPVELTEFGLTINNRNITIKWKTATEKNSMGFEIERAAENVQWSKIGFVKSAGNSAEVNSYEFTDGKLNSGNYIYRLKMIDLDGTFSYSDCITAHVELPVVYKLEQNYPNPFNPSTKIDYQLPFDSMVMLELYSITGEKISRLIGEEKKAGYYTYDLNAYELKLSSGIYIYRLISSNESNGEKYIDVKKMVFIK